VPSPGLIAAMPSRLGVSCAPRPEQHLVAVVEVQAVPAGGGVGLQMMQRHAAPHNSPTYMESAGEYAPMQTAPTVPSQHVRCRLGMSHRHAA
jgi:hypothetical protein